MCKLYFLEYRECIEVVRLLNQIVFDHYEQDELCKFSYSTNGDSHVIVWDGVVIYDSQESDRGWIDENDDYERTVQEQAISEFGDVFKSMQLINKRLTNG